MQVHSGSSQLRDIIQTRLGQSVHQRLTFAEFMELALYHEDYGYYTAHRTPLGPAGDFVTAAHLGSDFGELIAQQLAEMWHRLGCCNPFHIVEMGPGQGLLADTILTYLHQQAADCFSAAQYTLIETSPTLRTQQQQGLQPWQNLGMPIRWCSLAELPPASITGCFFSNELVDAFPAHRITLTETGLQEQYVVESKRPEQWFQASLGPLSTSALSQYFESLDLSLTSPPYPIGYTTEVNLAALHWMETVASKLHQGYVITVDYGYSAQRYYLPRRAQGTLQCYYRHSFHDNPFINMGQQDITTHVNFTALEQQGQRHDLETLGCLPQELFLMALGLGDRLQQLSQLPGRDHTTLNQVIQRRDALHQLISPLGLGRFTVLIQGKGLTHAAQRQLKGLQVPPSSL